VHSRRHESRHSPDPFQGCLWRAKNLGCSVAHPSVDALKISLLSEWVKLPQEALRASG